MQIEQSSYDFLSSNVDGIVTDLRSIYAIYTLKHSLLRLFRDRIAQQKCQINAL